MLVASPTARLGHARSGRNLESGVGTYQLQWYEVTLTPSSEEQLWLAKRNAAIMLSPHPLRKSLGLTLRARGYKGVTRRLATIPVVHPRTLTPCQSAAADASTLSRRHFTSNRRDEG